MEKPHMPQQGRRELGDKSTGPPLQTPNLLLCPFLDVAPWGPLGFSKGPAIRGSIY